MSQAFSDETAPPTRTAIAAALGTAAGAWDEAAATFEAAGVSVGWRYYRDGGWLAKATRGHQTMAWLRVGPGALRATFYFPARLRGELESELAPQLREQANNAIGRSIAISLELASPDLTHLEALVGLKLRMR